MFNIRRPAHADSVPQQSEWKTPTQEEIHVIQSYLGANIAKLLQKKIDTHPTRLVGYYRTTGVDRLFIKILSDENSDTQNNAEQISAWLYHHGLSVHCVRDEFPKKIVEYGLWIYVYDYLDFEFSKSCKKQLYSLGKEVNNMHRLMNKHPDRKNVYVRGTEKSQILFDQLNKIKSDKIVLNFPESAIEIIKETRDSDYQLLSQGAQMIHGDMNYGNVLFNKLSDQPIIIDFEDATTAWLSPLYDLAFIIQRFILLQEVKDRYGLGIALLKGYKSQNILAKTSRPNDLLIMLKMISVRSLLVLSMLSDENQILYLDEINKFIELYRQAQDDSELISDINMLIN
jgi:thiamine kinase-like enzyme